MTIWMKTLFYERVLKVNDYL